MTDYTMYCDGSSSPHSKKAAHYGFVILGETTVYTDSGPIDPSLLQTNNNAEYTSLIKGLEYCLANNITSLHIKMDSQLVVYQVSGRYKTKVPALKTLRDKVLSLIKEFENPPILEWIPREENLADQYSREIGE